MNDLKRTSFTEKLDGWLRQRFDIPAGVKNLARLTPVGNLNYRYSRICELYLRLWPVVDEGVEYWPAKTLVIARLEFRDTRSWPWPCAPGVLDQSSGDLWIPKHRLRVHA
jgi:hypothetical protein